MKVVVDTDTGGAQALGEVTPVAPVTDAAPVTPVAPVAPVTPVAPVVAPNAVVPYANAIASTHVAVEITRASGAFAPRIRRAAVLAMRAASMLR